MLTSWAKQSARDLSLGNPLRKEESRNITKAPEGLMNVEEIPYMTDAALGTPVKDVFPIANLIDEIANPVNISESFDYVVSHLENADQRKHMWPKKASYCKRLEKELKDGTFRITPDDVREITVKDGPKIRVCQCPYVYHRVGCHAVMVPVERHLHPTLIKNTAASIKGRGMHWLHQIIEEDLLADAENMCFFYQSDILGYFDHINQDGMKCTVRRYISDTKVLPMLDNFITLLPKGISKGLRSSQCLANLFLSDVDHKMCEKVSFHEIEVDGEKDVAIKGDGKVKIKGKEIRFHYYRYCDDIVIIAKTKKELWQLRNYLQSLLNKLGLTIKPSEAVRPLIVGMDYLGYKTFVDDTKPNRDVYSLIRKCTKQKFARRIKEVKSRKRRQSLIGSFFGMAAHADCKHLLKKLITPQEYKKLKHKRKVKDFGELKIAPTSLDGKKNFKGSKISPRELDKQPFILVDFERDLIPRRESDEYQRRIQDADMKGLNPDLVQKPKSKYLCQIIYRGTPRKMWTGDRELWSILEQLEKDGELPCFMSIEMDYTTQYPKANFTSATKFGHTAPSDEELNNLLSQLNIQLTTK